jgi:hypothetical protein
MPKLVREARRPVQEELGPTWGEVGSKVASGVEPAVRAAKVPLDLARAGTVAAAEALTPLSDPEKAVSAFRQFLKVQRYTPASAPTIQAAIDSGLLKPAELKIARQMLQDIQKENQ